VFRKLNFIVNEYFTFVLFYNKFALKEIAMWWLQIKQKGTFLNVELQLQLFLVFFSNKQKWNIKSFERKLTDLKVLRALLCTWTDWLNSDRQTNDKTDKRTNRQTDWLNADKKTNDKTKKRMIRQTNGRIYKQTNEYTKITNDKTDKRTNRQTDDWMLTKQMNE
jgi:hypothetical protein